MREMSFPRTLYCIIRKLLIWIRIIDFEESICLCRKNFLPQLLTFQLSRKYPKLFKIELDLNDN